MKKQTKLSKYCHISTIMLSISAIMTLIAYWITIL